MSTGCTIVSFDITGSTHPLDESALALAERFTTGLKDDSIRLPDETGNPLKIPQESIKITMKETLDAAADINVPVVSIDQAAYYVEPGDIAILRSRVMTSTHITSIAWFRINNDDGTEHAIDIDNEKYFGGSVESPSLVIDDTTVQDEGRYVCHAENRFGVGKTFSTSMCIFNRDNIETSLVLQAETSRRESQSLSSSKTTIDDGSTIQPITEKESPDNVFVSAATDGHTKTVKLLLEKGIDPYDYGVVESATGGGHTNTVEPMVEMGADPKRVSTTTETMAAKYISSRETTNFARPSRLLIDIYSDLFRSVLKVKCPPPGLSAILQSQKVQLCKILEQRQQEILYPSAGAFSGNLDDLDFTLLYKLLRNLQDINIPPHQKGWGKTPDNTDRSLSANIDRLKEERNEADEHLPTASLSDADFNARCDYIRQIISEIENDVLTGSTFVTAVDALLTMSMDHDTKQYNIQEFKAREAIPPKVAAMIATTRASFEEEKEKKTFIETKSFFDAKEKLEENRIVVIKGNTGDGKTATAIQLLNRLSNEQEDRQPLQIHKIEDLDLLPPNSKYLALIDDIFGEKVLHDKEVGEWNKRISSVNTKFCGDDQTQGNFLVITVRNEVFNSLKKHSLGSVFIDFNIIDLSSNTYQIATEKMDILEFYEPKENTFFWEDEEKDAVMVYAPNMGFPQCCRLFRDIPELQKERVNFFKKPLKFVNEALSRLEECSALLFLYLNGGIVQVKDLDPNSENVNTFFLEEAFKIDLIERVDDRTIITYEKRIGFVKKSLERLSGFLVVKEKDWSGEDVYRFSHDSICVAVTLLYGKATPIGYIRNCPSKSLSYLTTCTNSPDGVVISRNHYTYMCERLIREFECKGYDYGTSIASLDVWNDREFGDKFVRMLNDKKVEKLAVLNKACSYGAEECALYLLQEGVKPDKNTPTCILNGKSVNVLKALINYLNDEIKLALLGQACSASSLECAIYLLSIGVKPNKHTELWSLISIKKHKGDYVRLRRVAQYLNGETKRAMLNKACFNGTEECALYLLSQNVKPDNETPFGVVERGSVKVLRKLLQYDVTSTARDHYNSNVLYHSCLYQREEMVNMLCDTYPHMVHDHGWLGRTPLLVAATTGNCSMFRTVERSLLNSLYRIEDEQHKCESVDGRVVHRSCACAQYMSQLVCNDGCTVLHLSYRWGHKDLCLYLCQSYPKLTTVADKAGCHCLHYIARYTSDEVMFNECETIVKQYFESTGHTYDIKTILDSEGKSVLDKAEERKTEKAKYHKTDSSPLFDHLCKVFGR
ncbi:uncharacterized protein LOC110458269 [Mizuhopecten yessoensis]|uniref:uncharacterized protein LOC110458269 n=1 Tax=Mizuhopecten yessoensis TaxID=6573 RepID=UPI000B45AA41|nr:uncharacterized protein LOC110458269 [Mizuhopecten yessoensis]